MLKYWPSKSLLCGKLKLYCRLFGIITEYNVLSSQNMCFCYTLTFMIYAAPLL